MSINYSHYVVYYISISYNYKFVLFNHLDPIYSAPTPTFGNHYRCSVDKLCLTLQPHELQHARLPCPSVSPRVCSDSCPLSWWCYLTILSSATLFCFCLQPFPASGSFPMSWLFTSGGYSIGASASASFLPMNIQDWFPLGLTSLIFLQFKRLASLLQQYSKASVLRRSDFLWSNSHIRTWLLEKS